MSKTIPNVTIGLDLGDRFSYQHALDADGECLEEGRIRTTHEGLRQRFENVERARVVMEAGTHSPWVERLLEALGHEVIVANPRKLRAIYDNDRKSDQVDASTWPGSAGWIRSCWPGSSTVGRRRRPSSR